MDTGFHSPTSHGAYNNEWPTPEGAYVDGGFVSDPQGNKEQSYEEFETGGTDLIDNLPTNARIDGVEVAVKAKADTGAGGTIDISMNGDSNQKQNTWPGDFTYHTYTYGGSSDKWGKAWVRSDFTNATFWLYALSENTGQNYIDHIQVKVYYTEVLSDLKTINGVLVGSIKSVNTIDSANLKSVN